MPSKLKVTCINTTDGFGAHEGIENIGGHHWKHSEDDAINFIEGDVYSYCVSRVDTKRGS